jgi:hypothetical protein
MFNNLDDYLSKEFRRTFKFKITSGDKLFKRS